MQVNKRLLLASLWYQKLDDERVWCGVREDAVQSCEGAPGEASRQEGTARGVQALGSASLFFVLTKMIICDRGIYFLLRLSQ